MISPLEFLFACSGSGIDRNKLPRYQYEVFRELEQIGFVEVTHGKIVPSDDGRWAISEMYNCFERLKKRSKRG